MSGHSSNLTGKLSNQHFFKTLLPAGFKNTSRYTEQSAVQNKIGLYPNSHVYVGGSFT